MRIDCLHGFYLFEERKPGQVSDFMALYGLSIVRWKNLYTFEFLADAPSYSIAGKTYLGVPAVKTMEGDPWDIMRENQIIYDFNKGLALPLLSVVQRVEINTGAGYYISPGLIVPGSVTDDGSRVTDYAAWFLFESSRFKYSEVTLG